ncbi:MAG TPA: hypothetical protein VK735_10430 [Pseudonocardia sp.]|uniref:hypothetical protein n=1 Tax=Pseudonocardia sp. TaxID=60912 RepID=UPI002BACACFA|nr:hypothetical protein [Pseudonocardia sp.]HTF47855.1 hypothetical protein [Pseudonocardia sp.]
MRRPGRATALVSRRRVTTACPRGLILVSPLIPATLAAGAAITIAPRVTGTTPVTVSTLVTVTPGVPVVPMATIRVVRASLAGARWPVPIAPVLAVATAPLTGAGRPLPIAPVLAVATAPLVTIAAVAPFRAATRSASIAATWPAPIIATGSTSIIAGPIAPVRAVLPAGPVTGVGRSAAITRTVVRFEPPRPIGGVKAPRAIAVGAGGAPPVVPVVAR